MPENSVDTPKENNNFAPTMNVNEILSDLPISLNQIEAICDHLIDNCKKNGGSITYEETLNLLSSDIRLSLEKEKTSFIASHGIYLQLKNKTIIIRPLTLRDKPELLESFKRLSFNTQFLRFLSPIKNLTLTQVEYLLNVDFNNHYALAVTEDGPSFKGMATTRYIRSHSNSEEAEWAITIVDEYQGNGLGRILLYLISKIAYAHGIRVFIATVHPTNKHVLQWMNELNAQYVQTSDGLIWKVNLPIPESFFNNDEIKEKLQHIVDGTGNLPLYIAAGVSEKEYNQLMNNF